MQLSLKPLLLLPLLLTLFFSPSYAALSDARFLNTSAPEKLHFSNSAGSAQDRRSGGTIHGGLDRFALLRNGQLTVQAKHRIGAIAGGLAILTAVGEEDSGVSSLLNALKGSSSTSLNPPLMDTFYVRPDYDMEPERNVVYAVLLPVDGLNINSAEGVSAVLVIDLPPFDGDEEEAEGDHAAVFAVVMPFAEVLILNWMDTDVVRLLMKCSVALLRAQAGLGKVRASWVAEASQNPSDSFADTERSLTMLGRQWGSLILLHQGSPLTSDWSSIGDDSENYFYKTPKRLRHAAASYGLFELFSEIYEAHLPQPSLSLSILNDLSLHSLSDLHPIYRTQISAFASEALHLAAAVREKRPPRTSLRRVRPPKRHSREKETSSPAKLQISGWVSGTACARIMEFTAKTLFKTKPGFIRLPTRRESFNLQTSGSYREHLEVWGAQAVLEAAESEQILSKETLKQESSRIAREAERIFSGLAGHANAASEHLLLNKEEKTARNDLAVNGVASDRQLSRSLEEVETPKQALSAHSNNVHALGRSVRNAVHPAELLRLSRLRSSIDAYLTNHKATLAELLQTLIAEELPITPDSKVQKFFSRSRGGGVEGYRREFAVYDEPGVHDVREGLREIETQIEDHLQRAVVANTEAREALFIDSHEVFLAAFLEKIEPKRAVNVHNLSTTIQHEIEQSETAWKTHSHILHKDSREWDLASAKHFAALRDTALSVTSKNRAQIEDALREEIEVRVEQYYASAAALFVGEAGLLPEKDMKDRVERLAVLATQEFNDGAPRRYLGEKSSEPTGRFFVKTTEAANHVLSGLNARWEVLLAGVTQCAEGVGVNGSELSVAISRSHVARLLKREAERCYLERTKAEVVPRLVSKFLQRWSQESSFVCVFFFLVFDKMLETVFQLLQGGEIFFLGAGSHFFRTFCFPPFSHTIHCNKGGIRSHVLSHPFSTGRENRMAGQPDVQEGCDGSDSIGGRAGVSQVWGWGCLKPL